ncbi:UTP--glucose-1-phosphate uridylyltransferase GalU [Streptomyces longwoodensis]|uniref:UTP--glucose-1-phosphate uridylyltransferase GalU n=1 Tax=Streptomyces longwoodensis TaxID=68231 RepID=UPI00224F5D5F|nr:UTP--glucose-1-phosphate uridylyltransferase GalU [Streptomyces longwoodensis]MCX4999568.1 UTP--glucose-1-phosphate uridylyltransferase GalU [Streptomyces longwoodensis]WUC74589.1 UTP--glucose-1-phosphate uridylyltransferase GalU [Streptomyces longwoodensis]
MIAPHSSPTPPPAPLATVRKAVVPAAGLGTRFLPATKATPKEMLPVVDKPAIQYVVEEAAAAGLDDILMVTGRHKRAIEDHFDHAFELEQALAAKGDTVRLDAVRDPARLADIHHIRQGDPLGLGHAVLCARHHVGEQPFAVLLGDDLIDPRETLLSRMLEVRGRYGGSVVALMEVPPEQVHRYGCAAVEPSGEDGIVRVTGLVEKPARAQAPSRYAVIGRYVLDPAVFDVLERTPPGRGGEIQLTDALGELAAAGTVHGVVFDGPRYDTGDKADYLRTVVRLACAREDLGPQFRAWLRQFVAELEATAPEDDRLAA